MKLLDAIVNVATVLQMNLTENEDLKHAASFITQIQKDIKNINECISYVQKWEIDINFTVDEPPKMRHLAWIEPFDWNEAIATENAVMVPTNRLTSHALAPTVTVGAEENSVFETNSIMIDHMDIDDKLHENEVTVIPSNVSHETDGDQSQFFGFELETKAIDNARNHKRNNFDTSTSRKRDNAYDDNRTLNDPIDFIELSPVRPRLNPTASSLHEVTLSDEIQQQPLDLSIRGTHESSLHLPAQCDESRSLCLIDDADDINVTHLPEFDSVSMSDACIDPMTNIPHGNTTNSENFSFERQTVNEPVLSMPTSSTSDSSVTDLPSDFRFWASRVRWKISLLSMQICNTILTIVMTTAKWSSDCKYNDSRSTPEYTEQSGNQRNYIQLVYIFIAGLVVMKVGTRITQTDSPNIGRNDTVMYNDSNFYPTNVNDEHLVQSKLTDKKYADTSDEFVDSSTAHAPMVYENIVDIRKIDTKLQEVSNLLHDTLPFISTLCRVNSSYLHTSTAVQKIEVNKKRSTVYYNDGSSSKKYTFDSLFDGGSTQQELFEHINEKLEKACIGTTVLFVAIGSSGTGKTYTLVGKNDEMCTSDGDIRLIGRTLQYKLKRIHDAEKLYVSSFEISLNVMSDLLRNKRAIDSDDIRTNAIRRNRIKRAEDVHSFINVIRNDRTTATTRLNSRSSHGEMRMALIEINNQQQSIALDKMKLERKLYAISQLEELSELLPPLFSIYERNIRTPERTNTRNTSNKLGPNE